MVDETSAIVELRRRSGVGIFAVTYRAGRPRKAMRLPDGMIVEIAAPDERREAPDRPEASLGVTTDGRPATIHDLNLGLVASHVLFDGVYLLPSGEVAAVYGAEAIPIGPTSGQKGRADP